MSRRAGGIPAVFLLLAALGCGGDAAPEHPAARVALDVFELARLDEPSEEQLGLFEADTSLAARAALLDALDGLALSTAPRLLAVQEAGGDEAFVDFAAALDGGGEALFTVRVRSTGPDSWRVTWFQGPGVEWPERSTAGDGLSSSNPPQ